MLKVTAINKVGNLRLSLEETLQNASEYCSNVLSIYMAFKKKGFRVEDDKWTPAISSIPALQKHPIRLEYKDQYAKQGANHSFSLIID